MSISDNRDERYRMVCFEETELRPNQSLIN